MRAQCVPGLPSPPRRPGNEANHIQAICRIARQVLGIIYHNFASNIIHYSVILLRLYIALVQLHLEYVVHVWKLHLAKYVYCIEKVQKCAIFYHCALFIIIIKNKLIYFLCDSVQLCHYIII